MTCREKLMRDHPELDAADKVCADRCPSWYGYMDDPEWCSDITCEACWNREMDRDRTTIIDEICETRKRLVDAGFTPTEAFNLICLMFESRWKNV